MTLTEVVLIWFQKNCIFKFAVLNEIIRTILISLVYQIITFYIIAYQPHPQSHMQWFVSEVLTGKKKEKRKKKTEVKQHCSSVGVNHIEVTNICVKTCNFLLKTG